MLDRLLHHCHVVITDGDSCRMSTSPNSRRNQDQQQLEGRTKSGDFHPGHQRDHELAVDTDCTLARRDSRNLIAELVHLIRR
jgi:hypothetical protein